MLILVLVPDGHLVQASFHLFMAQKPKAPTLPMQQRQGYVFEFGVLPLEVAQRFAQKLPESVNDRFLWYSYKLVELRKLLEMLYRGMLLPDQGKARKEDQRLEVYMNHYFESDPALLSSLKEKLHTLRRAANDQAHTFSSVRYDDYLAHLNTILEFYDHIRPAEAPELTNVTDGQNQITVRASVAGNLVIDSPPMQENETVAALLGFMNGVNQEDRTLSVLIKFHDGLLTRGTVKVPDRYWEYNQLKPGVPVALLEVTYSQELYTASHLVLYPDYLIEASSIGYTFDSNLGEKGKLSYLALAKEWSKTGPSTTSAMMLGNISGQILQEALTQGTHRFDINAFINQTLLETFGPDLAAITFQNQGGNNAYKELVDNIKTQYAIIKTCIDNDFRTGTSEKEVALDQEKLMLEASFLSPVVGISGRADIAHDRSDYQLMRDGNRDWYVRTNPRFDLVEQKSGKAPNAPYYNYSHWAQVMAYQLIIRAAYKLDESCVSTRMLYSKSAANPIHLVQGGAYGPDAIFTHRNNIAAFQVELARCRNAREVLEVLEPLLGLHTEEPIPNNAFAIRDLQPLIRRLAEHPTKLTTWYWLEWVRFQYAEKLYSKTGNPERDTMGGQSSLWRKPVPEKIANCELVHSLHMRNRQQVGRELRLNRNMLMEREVRRHLDLPDTLEPAIREGDRVVLYPFDINNETTAHVVNNQLIRASVKGIDHEEVVLALNDPLLNDVYVGKHQFWAIEKEITETRTDHMIAALFSVINGVYPGGIKPQVLLGHEAPAAGQAIAWPIDGLAQDTLSAEQKELLGRMVGAQDYFLLQGPPGTGKTRFMIRNLAWYYGIHTQQKVLFVAYTNRSVDEICEQLVWLGEHENKTRKLDFVRIGHHVGSHPDYHSHLLQDRIKHIAKDGDDAPEERLTKLNEFMEGIHVVAGTSTSLMSHNAINQKIPVWDVVIVDEASQMTEPQLMFFLQRARKFILIGDHKQLPAVVVQPEDNTLIGGYIEFPDQEPDALPAEHYAHITRQLKEKLNFTDMRTSYLERIWYRLDTLNATYAKGQLTRQGRMHEDIGSMVSYLSYDGGLNVADEVRQKAAFTTSWQDAEWRLGPDITDILSAHRVVFIDIPTTEDDQPSSKMKISEAQMAAQLAMAVAERVHAQGQKLKPEEVGIIAPFRNQVATIQSEFECALKLQKREKVVETIKSWLPNITTDTVERYQGSQRDTIIISFTAMSEAQTRSICSYDQQQTVDRKLNVALSRARQQLIMLGDAALLRQQPKYAQMLDYVQQKHGFISLELEEIASIY